MPAKINKNPVTKLEELNELLNNVHSNLNFQIESKNSSLSLLDIIAKKEVELLKQENDCLKESLKMANKLLQDMTELCNNILPKLEQINKSTKRE